MSTEAEFPGFGKRCLAAQRQLRAELPPFLQGIALDLAAIGAYETLWHESALLDREGRILELANRAAGGRVFLDARLANSVRSEGIRELFEFDGNEISFGPPSWPIAPTGRVVLLLETAIGWTTAAHAQRWVDFGPDYRAKVVRACEVA